MPTTERMIASEPDRLALDELFSLAYEELRRLASSVRRDDPGATLSPTALVNEAWLKLAQSPAVARTSALHFKRIAARAMRQVLVEAARRRTANKRGGGLAALTLEEFRDGATDGGGSGPEALLALEEALTALAVVSQRQAQLVECRFFGGLEVAETAELLGISESTVLREWRVAKAWLARAMRDG
jgi:RNA polymerase sigma factor (TIGR02999 family)